MEREDHRPVRVLYMEDDAGLARLVQRRLTKNGYVVDLASNGNEGLALYEAGSYDVVLLDHDMPECDGMKVIRSLVSRGELPPTIMITGAGSESIAVEAMKLGVADYIVKDSGGNYVELIPSVIERVLAQRRLMIEKRRAEEALRRAKDELETKVKERTSELKGANEALNRELDEKKAAEGRLLESELRLRLLSLQLMTAQEQERKRIARELHDSIGQSLTTIKLRVEAVKRHIDGGETRAALTSTDDVITTVRQAIDEVRKVVMDLRPSTLDDLGIVATLKWFCREFRRTYPDIEVDERIDIDEADVPERLVTALFRIVQEAFNNAAKHSRATRIVLGIARRGETLELSVSDDGAGFDVKQALSLESGRTTFGLTSMLERVAALGGSFSIESEEKRGTMVRATFLL